MFGISKGMDMKFMIGADTSSLEAMEDQGARFYDINGEENDAIKVLAAHGVNFIRLRLFNRPTKSFDGGDYCNLDHTLSMAKRIKAYGLGFMLDFHYSDFWADWKSQTIPHDWEKQSADEIENSVYEYTKNIVKKFIEQGTVPDVVQIGNEIGKGLLWEYGSLKNPKQITAFLNSGLKAVDELNIELNEIDAEMCTDNNGVEADAIMSKDNDNSVSIRTMLHVECGADTKRTEQFFSELYKEGLREFDYIGLSYYPYWAGDYSMLINNMKNIDNKFHKEVVVVETAFPYTDESHDDMPNVVTGKLTKQSMGLEPSVENQKAVTEKVIKTVKDMPNGAGVFYWEPVWYQVPGVGVSKGKGNEWENQAMFDNQGHALESLKAFGK